MTTTTTVSAREVGLAALTHARNVTKRLAEDIAEKDMTTIAGAAKKNAAWLLGHIAATDDYFRTKLSDQPSVLPEGFGEPFGMGSEAVDDPKKYPSKAELLKAVDTAHQALVTWFESLSDEQLAAPMPEGLEVFGPNYATLAATMGWHEGVHNGQMIEVRHHLGMPRAFG